MKLTGVTKRFGLHTVLYDVDLEIQPRSRHILQGPNGAGKTTLLRIAAGLLRPTTGTATRHGRDMTHPEARRGVAYLDQDAAVYHELTVREHLQWWGRIHGKHIEDAWLDRIGLRRLGHDPAGTLSRGQRQRLRLGMALATEPDILLLDEPTTALDQAGQTWLLDALQNSGAAMLIATHDDLRIDAEVHRL